QEGLHCISSMVELARVKSILSLTSVCPLETTVTQAISAMLCKYGDVCTSGPRSALDAVVARCCVGLGLDLRRYLDVVSIIRPVLAACNSLANTTRSTGTIF